MSTITRGLLLAAALTAGWLGTLRLAAAGDRLSTEALVLWPAPGLVAALPTDVAVIAVGRHSLRLSGAPGLPARLSAAGVRAVLPARGGTCLVPPGG